MSKGNKPVSDDKEKTTQSDDSSIGKKASVILQATIHKIGRKMMDPNYIPSKDELAIVESVMGKHSDAEFAKNYVELADCLGVTRQTIHRLSKMPGAPAPRSDGRHSVKEWREFYTGTELEDEDEALNQTLLKARQIFLQNAILEHRLTVLRKEFVAVADVHVWIAEMIDQAKKRLLAIPPSLAPQVVGVPIPEAEKILRDAVNDALAQLSDNPESAIQNPEAAE